ncbi:MAG TPA: hypothetical protein VIH08_03215, partial [Blastococcus sp.]
MSFAPRTPKAAVLGLTVGALVTSGFALAPAASAESTDARITEIHYDNAGTDTGEAIEVSAPSAVDLKNLTLVLYNGNGGASYNTKALPRPAAGQTAATARYPTNGIQNGGDDTAPGSSPDGVALVGPDGAVIEFLSYEGTFVATNGPAQGMRSVDIGVSERSGTATGLSLQRDFATGTWSGPKASTFAPDAEPLCAGVRTVPIGEVQGDGDSTPCSGATVTVEGSVVGDLQEGGFDGFFVQDAGDGDPATSDGIFVYGAGTPDVRLGDRVRVTGTAGEFNGLTQLTARTVDIVAGGALPAPAVLPLPSSDAQREALEGMLVAAGQPLTVSEVFNLDRYGEVLLSSGGRLVTPTEAAQPGPGAAAV